MACVRGGRKRQRAPLPGGRLGPDADARRGGKEGRRADRLGRYRNDADRTAETKLNGRSCRSHRRTGADLVRHLASEELAVLEVALESAALDDDLAAQHRQ